MSITKRRGVSQGHVSTTTFWRHKLRSHKTVAISVSLMCVHTWLLASVLQVLTRVLVSMHMVMHCGEISLFATHHYPVYGLFRSFGNAQWGRNESHRGDWAKGVNACSCLHPIISSRAHSFCIFLKIPQTCMVLLTGCSFWQKHGVFTALHYCHNRHTILEYLQNL